MTETGILNDRRLRTLIADDAIMGLSPFEDGQIQPASVDLRLGTTAYRLRASFLPGTGHTVRDRLDSDVVMHRGDKDDMVEENVALAEEILMRG